LRRRIRDTVERRVVAGTRGREEDMPNTARAARSLLTILSVMALAGCKEEAASEAGAASAKLAPSAAPVASASAAEPKPEPPPKPREDCPEGSSGIGTFEQPCLASGASRMMEVAYTGKTTDEGPKFSVTNRSKLPILYGSIAVYFYDKKGKQLEVTAGEKAKPKQVCSGNIFAGAVKPDEKIYVFFSCVKKSHVPEGTETIEAEIQTVGFANAEGNQNEFYWKNPDLVPDERPKGGLKAKGKK
jgi:hypothetical protein